MLGIGLYALLSVLLAMAWWWLSGIYGRCISARTGYAVWARSQWAKYLPGNAFHFVSRQMLGKKAGLTHPALVASGFLEMGSLLFAAVLIAAAGSATKSWSEPVTRSLPWVFALAAGCLLAWPAIDAMLRRWPRTAAWMEPLPCLSMTRTWRLLGPSIGLHVVFFVGTGSVFYALMVSAWGKPPVDVWSVVWLYTVAWAAGTVSIGAPAGLGVREAILTLELEPFLGPANAAALAVALRVVTTGGDLLTAVLGWRLGDRSDGDDGTLPRSVRADRKQ